MTPFYEFLTFWGLQILISTGLTFTVFFILMLAQRYPVDAGDIRFIRNFTLAGWIPFVGIAVTFCVVVMTLGAAAVEIWKNYIPARVREFPSADNIAKGINRILRLRAK